MDALEILRERRRMCNSYRDCEGCPLAEGRCVINHVTSDEDCKRIVTAVEQWSKEHPRKTRQSVFLEQWPNVITNNGVISILPCAIDQSLAECRGENCPKCRREFWMQEVE